MKQKIKTYIIFILIPLAVGGLSAILTAGNVNIYDEIIKPPLSPPSILFPIVWSILYILMGVSSALIYTERGVSMQRKKSALYIYALSLFVNFLWSIIFFNMRSFFLAFIWILLLLLLILLTIIRYYQIKPLAAYLQIPYLIWVVFATYLTLSILINNR